jgi:D-alanine transaminase
MISPSQNSELLVPAMTDDVVYFNGVYCAKSEVRIDPDERGWLLGDGVYEVTPAYHGACIGLDRHVVRLERNLREAAIAEPALCDWRTIVTTLLERNELQGAPRAMVYIQVTRGVAPRMHAYPRPAVEPTVYAYAKPFRRNPDATRGCHAITVSDTRWGRCDIKTTSLIANCMANQRAHEAHAYEAIFVRDGAVLEGTHSSVFAVIDGVVRTAPLSNYVLPGITREIVLSMCRQEEIIAREATITESEFRRAEEIFVTGTTTEILPVVRLDGRPVAMGDVGSVTQRLQRSYDAMIADAIVANTDSVGARTREAVSVSF